MRVSMAAAAILVVLAACSSGSNCPLTAPGTGDSCGDNATCTYGPVSCTCSHDEWQCDLPYSPEVTPGASSDDGSAESVGSE